MKTGLLKWLKRGLVKAAIVFVSLVGLRAYDPGAAELPP